MKRLVIRHGQTPANRLNRAAYGKFGASLNDKGIEQARELGRQLDEMDIDKSQPVAVSEMHRAVETAKYAGFSVLVTYPELNELELKGDIKAIIADATKDILPPEAEARANQLLENPPPEAIWFTHGLVIGGLREIREVPCDRLVPTFCEITEINI